MIRILVRLSFLIFTTFSLSLIKSTSDSFPYLEMVRAEFGNWIVENQREYTSPSEFDHRFNVFLKNKLKIEQHNSNNLNTYKLAINKFADMTDQEYMSLFPQTPSGIDPLDLLPSFLKDIISFLFPTKIQQKLKTRKTPNYDDLPIKNIDWEKKGAMSEIRDQKNLGACYAFSTVAATEAAYYIKTTKRIRLSEQQMIDCGLESEFTIGGGLGSFGDADGKYLLKYGLHSGDQFPYKEKEDKCQKTSPVIKVKEIKTQFANSFELLKELAFGPIAAYIEWNVDLQLYNSDVFDIKYPCGIFPNHAVTIVGYDVTAPIPYLKIRNSHGITWGDKGYGLFALRNAEDCAFCGLNSGKEFRPVLED